MTGQSPYLLPATSGPIVEGGANRAGAFSSIALFPHPGSRTANLCLGRGIGGGECGCVARGRRGVSLCMRFQLRDQRLEISVRTDRFEVVIRRDHFDAMMPARGGLPQGGDGLFGEPPTARLILRREVRLAHPDQTRAQRLGARAVIGIQDTRVRERLENRPGFGQRFRRFRTPPGCLVHSPDLVVEVA